MSYITEANQPPGWYPESTGDSGGGITPTGTKYITIEENGTTTEDVTEYASAEITVDVQGGGLPQYVTKISSGTFTFTSDTALTAQIPHDLGVVPRAVIVWRDPDPNGLYFYAGSLIAQTIPTTGNTYYASRGFVTKQSASTAETGSAWVTTNLSDLLGVDFFWFNNGSRKFQGGVTYYWVAFA